MSSFFPWMGGKTKLLGRLLSVMPPHECYVEVFSGAANLLFTKAPAGCEVLNDINGGLVNLFRVVKFHRREFLREILLVTHSRREFSDFLAAVHRCHKRLAGVIVEQLDFADCIRRYDRTHTFFYCDPPYIGTAGYQADFSLADHNRLAGALAKIKGKFLLSINDCSTARQVYGGFKIKTVTTTYTVCRDKSPDAQKARGELLISNYSLGNCRV